MGQAPDGHITHLQDAARWVQRAVYVWMALFVISFAMTSAMSPILLLTVQIVLQASLLPLAWGLWVATRPGRMTGRRLSVRHLTRLLLPVSLLVSIYQPASWELGYMLPLLAWSLVPLAFWGFCRQLVQRNNPLATRINQLLLAWGLLDALTAAAVLPFVVRGLSSSLTETIFTLALVTWMLAATALWYIGGRVMRASENFGLGQHTNLQEYVETGAFRLGESWLSYARSQGWTMTPDEDGAVIEGQFLQKPGPPGRGVTIRLMAAKVPVSVTICVEATALQGLTIGPRGTLPERQTLSDALLNSLLDVHAVGDLAQRLRGQHEALMEIFHAHPSARLRDGQLTIETTESSPLVIRPLLEQANQLLNAMENPSQAPVAPVQRVRPPFLLSHP